MKKSIFVLIIVTTFCTACSSQQKNTANANENQPKISTEMIQDGFHLANIVKIENKDFPCHFLIKLNDNNILLEPLHPLAVEFHKNQEAVWVKYHPQRRMSRCGDTQPVEIIDIKKVD